ncbi:hypothetical protein MRB53_030685 [Persea americana]|uniref:Uncharacterized protein n=1 Tax=Persea americana TaxID=3435 RepID=A0ACC2KM08_PERAE|nr:hypothetical protein MRB53_030685 [Persea americana]
MAFSTCIRFTASCLLLSRQQRLSFPVLCDLRFLSGVSRRTPSVRAVRAKRREEEGDEGRGGDNGNGRCRCCSGALCRTLGGGLKPVHRRIL